MSHSLAHSISATMRALVVVPGGVEIQTRPRPEPRPHEVLVKVAAAALNRADLQVAAGHRHGSSGGIGAVVGLEWAGTVVAVGAEVPATLKPGMAVMGSGTGAFADYAVSDWGRVYALPEGWTDWPAAAALPVALQTAHEALVGSGGFQRGQSVMVQGASSGVGLMALQIARLLGAGRVIGSSTTAARRARLRDFGADVVVDSNDPAWPQQVLEATGGAGVDLLIDFIAGPQMNPNMQATRICGCIVNVGRLGGFNGEFDFDLHSLRRLRYVGATFRTRSLDEVRAIAQRMRADLWPAIERGELRLPVCRRFPFEEAVAALAFMRANAHFGKVTLDL